MTLKISKNQLSFEACPIIILEFVMVSELESTREILIAALRDLYLANGYVALTTPFLEKQRLYMRLRAVGLKQPDYLAALGLVEEFAKWKFENRTYGGMPQQRWTWERAVETAQQAIEVHDELPTMDWFRKNKQTNLVNAVFRSGHTWEDLREALGHFSKSTFRQSRNGMRWLSQPETSMSDFLFARGVLHKRGHRYDQGYADVTGRRHGAYDVHFQASDGRWIDVEIWGDLPDKLSGGKYANTRALKEAWNRKNNSNFLGIQFQNCYSDITLTKILMPYIGEIDPFNFSKPTDPHIETSHWTDGEELLETCRQLAETMPGKIFPNEQWLRKRGKYAARAGESYNSLALRINQWLGGTRNVRKLLNQANESTTKWSAKLAIVAWREFHVEHGVAPTTLAAAKPNEAFTTDIIKRANAIRAAAMRFGVLDEARGGKKGRVSVWTESTIRQAWQEFEKAHGLSPSKAVGTKRRAQYSPEIGNHAARIYRAATKRGMLELLRNQDSA